MKLEARIAARYLFGRQQRSVVSVISWISVVGLLVSTAALIVVLSVYNGIGKLTRSLFATFDAELLITPSEGKTLHASAPLLTSLQADPSIEALSLYIDETAWLTYGSNQAIVQLRGVDENYHLVSGIDTLLAEGTYFLNAPFASGDSIHTLIAGGEIYYQLAMALHASRPASLLIPRRGTTSLGYSIDQAFNISYAYPTGYFFIQNDIDRQYVLTDITLLRELLQYAPDECTSIGLRLRQGTNASRFKHQLETRLASTAKEGEVLTVKDRYDQQPLYFKIFRTERLGIYLILSLIVLISTLSLVASLSLLIINKRQDIFTLRSLGFTSERLRRTFLCEGLLICAVAVVGGLLLGFAICWLQQTFGLIRMGDGNFVVSVFPVAMRWADFLNTFLLVMALSTIAVTLTVKRSKL